MYLIDYDVVALLLCAITLYFFYLKKRIADKRSKRFALLLWSILASAVLSIATSLWINGLPDASVFLIIAGTTLYYLVHASIPLLAALYVLSVGECCPRLAGYRLLFFVPGLLQLALLIANVPTGILFSVSAEGVYQYGGWRFLLYVLSICYLIVTIAALSSVQKLLGRIRTLAFVPALLLPFATIAIQHFYPALSLENFAAAFSTLFVLLTIQNSNDLTDGQTGLYNQEGFSHFVREAFLGQRSFRIVLVHTKDLEYLRGFLDREAYIHIMQEFSRFLARLAGKKAEVCMLESGMFATIFSREQAGNPAGEFALGVLERCRSSWRLDELTFDITVRIGLLSCPEDCPDAMAVMDLADQLAELPERTGNRHVYYASDFRVGKYRHEAEIAFKLKEALEHGKVELFFQPIFSVRERRIVAVEILVGLSMADGELVRQSQVLNIAERIGVAQDLFSAVLSGACSWFSANDLPSFGVESLQVRLFESTCLELDWPHAVLRTVRLAGMEPSRLCLEVTEPAVVNTWKNLQLNMDLLRGLGVTFALDDYGSSCTDLGHILDMSFSIIKLDKRLVQEGLREEKGRKLLAGALTLFKGLDRLIVAEGIETVDQSLAMEGMGCDLLQGYLYGRPMRGPDLLGLLS